MPSDSIISIGAIGCFAAGSGVGGGGDGAGDEVRRPLGAGGWLAVPGTTIGWGFGAAAGGAKARICTGEPTGEVFIEFFDGRREFGCELLGDVGLLDFQSNMFISEPRRTRVSFISSCVASWNVVPSGPFGVGGSDIVEPVDGLPSAHTMVRQ